jgi:hypothetical protein
MACRMMLGRLSALGAEVGFWVWACREKAARVARVDIGMAMFSFALMIMRKTMLPSWRRDFPAMKIKRRESTACEQRRARAVLREMEALLSAEVGDGSLLETDEYVQTRKKLGSWSAWSQGHCIL